MAEESIRRCQALGEKKTCFSPSALADIMWSCARLSYGNGHLIKELQRCLGVLLDQTPCNRWLPASLFCNDGNRSSSNTERVQVLRLHGLLQVIDAQVTLRCINPELMEEAA